jgi:hypothetical protein
MENRVVVGVFRTHADAESARAALIGSGVAADRMALEPVTGRDPVGDEFPGESYENQPGEDERADAAARFGESVRSGGCTLAVSVPARAEEERIAGILRERGATRTTRPAA